MDSSAVNQDAALVVHVGGSVAAVSAPVMLAVILLVAVVAALVLWPLRKRLPEASEVRASYANAFADVGWGLADVAIVPLDAHLFQLEVWLAPTDHAGCLTDVTATAMLVGFNAMDRWPGLISYEARLPPPNDGAAGGRIVAVLRHNGSHIGEAITGTR
jgi:CO/xanthine dehydrogenase Mo-binding subunit